MLISPILFPFREVQRMRRAGVLPVLLLVLSALALSAAACARRAARIEVLPPKLSIYGLDRPQRLTARILDKSGSPLEIGTANWESSRKDVATVDAGGLISPKSEGKTLITARYETVSTAVPVEIIDVKAIEVAEPSVRLVGPRGTQVPIQSVVRNSRDRALPITPVWSSSAPAIASVSPEGIVTSSSSGKALLIARVGDVQGACEVTVEIRDIARLEIRPATALVRVGDTQHFEVVAYGLDGKIIEGPAVLFRSSNPAVATVDASGHAHGASPGAATIRATLAGAGAESTLIVN